MNAAKIVGDDGIADVYLARIGDVDAVLREAEDVAVLNVDCCTRKKPPGAVFEIAPGKVLHGAVRLHGLASSPTPETSACLGVRRGASSSSSESTRVIILPSRGSKLAHSWMALRQGLPSIAVVALRCWDLLAHDTR